MDNIARKTRECLIGKHKFNDDNICIYCQMSREQIKAKHEVEFLEQLLNANVKKEDKKILLKELGYEK